MYPRARKRAERRAGALASGAERSSATAARSGARGCHILSTKRECEKLRGEDAQERRERKDGRAGKGERQTLLRRELS